MSNVSSVLAAVLVAGMALLPETATGSTFHQQVIEGSWNNNYRNNED